MESTRYTRNALNYLYVDDEESYEILSNTPYENQLIKFDQSLNSIEQSMVFYGSSSIRLWSTLATDFSNISINVTNRGFGGSTLKQCWQQFKRIILPLEPRLLIVYAGENDIAKDQTPKDIQLVFRQLILTIRRFFPSLPVAYISIKPSPRRFNKITQVNITNHLIEEDSKTMDNVDFINIFNQMLTSDGQPRPELFISDNLHMNEQGYAIWTQAIYAYLHMNGFISHGLNNYEISFPTLIVLNIFVFYTNSIF